MEVIPLRISFSLNRARHVGVMETVIDAFGKSRLLSFDHDPSTRTPDRASGALSPVA